MTPLEIAERLLLAAALGAIIGLEREYWHKPAGLRTNILIAVGSVMTLSRCARHFSSASRPVSRSLESASACRRFSRRRVILRSGTTVRGMTTAATIWVNAAIGMAAGAGEYALATGSTVVTLVVLVVLPPIEGYFERRRTDERNRRKQ
jgi:putative Mg2+ transporter-C (MgtC) family protein